MTDKVSIAIKWLKENGIWNRMVVLPKPAAIELCSLYFDRQTCTTIVDSMK